MREWQFLTRHAGTVFVGQIAVMAFGVTDTLVAARYSGEALAALSVGSATYISIFVALLGVLSAQLPTWSELRGAGKTLALGRSVRQSLYLAAAVTVAGMAILLLPGPLLAWTRVPPSLIPVSSRRLSSTGQRLRTSSRMASRLRLASEGNTNDAIGSKLFISPDTVRSHMRHAMEKLEADSRTEAVAKALRQHLIQ